LLYTKGINNDDPENTDWKARAKITYVSIAFTTNTEGKKYEYEHEFHEQYRDAAAGHLAHSQGCGRTCPGCVFQWSGNDFGDTSRTRWNIHLAA
jgi:hypothetical protein